MTAGKIFAPTAFFYFIQFEMQNYQVLKRLILFCPKGRRGGGGSVDKIFATMLLHYGFHTI